MDDVEFELLIEPPGSEGLASFEQLAEGLAATAAALLRLRNIEPPRMRLRATGDFAGAIAAEHERLRIPYDAGRGLERIGGTVGGKTLTADDGSEATVIVPVEYARVDHPEGQLTVAGLLGHEFGHVVYGRQRDLAVGRTTDVWLPWEVAEMIAVLAAEEFRVGVLGFFMAERFVTMTANGEAVPLGTLARRDFQAGLPDALDAISPGLPDAVWKYRLNGGSVEPLWVELARTCEGGTIYLAHLNAARGLGDPGIEELAALDHPGFELLRPVWEPLAEHLNRTAAFPEPDEWTADRAELKRIGLEGFTEVWRRLGVAAWPQGDSFYLSVEEPGRGTPVP